ncbi:O-antigen ligase family protein [Mesorhizobium sp. B1-1-7]|uniref:O-antigen ligase family protein n=1 Tax=Mesorhizobium sp. B1-1-7 TaxID=2589977 RepID=UPI001127EFFB|nr:O-antigen ligase family protein [Mesorhizobium sp. B1-1-7]TPN43197.1 hypothetical protein FJ978_31330 [Mesorhizobium sp. B1-1-7]
MGFRIWVTALFVGAIFLGSVWLWKVTLPISILLLPFLFLDRSQLTLRLPSAAFPLLALGAIIVVQFLINFHDPSFQWKADLAVWMPPMFAGLTILGIRGEGLTDRLTFRSMVTGGALTALIMLLMIGFAPKGVFLLPGQDASNVEATYAAERAANTVEPAPAVQAPVAQSVPPASQPVQPAAPAGREAFSPKDGGNDTAFYDLKNRARTLLGLSNYIAVFMVFLFAVTLFSGLPFAAAAFGVMTALTLSRFGIVMLAAVTVIYLFRRKVPAVRMATILAALCGLGMAALYLGQDLIPHIPGSSSLMARLEYWDSGVDALRLHPIIGAPRSVYLVEMDNSITWNPHNSILWVAVNFGLVGLLAYIAYVWIAMREIAKAALTSDLWKGVFVGVAMILAWSLEEIIVLTPAFELLLAALYMLGHNVNAPRSIHRASPIAGPLH